MSEEPPSAKKARTCLAATTSPPLSGRRLERLRLEAIFHPKFENENRTTMDVRRQMLQAVGASEGYLEASLKHSGSLVLWSGGMRFYSKNSMENSFTHVGEILLRQHLARAWVGEEEADIVHGVVPDVTSERKYKELSHHVELRRLTLSFEVVTSVLGQHGSLPRRDFLILTAVADRAAERFFGTSELVALAQQFRLPHNDSWVFRSVESAESLFEVYDSTRETALADGTIAALTASCDGGHVRSIYPHVQFQGNILEGIVIRYVPYLIPGEDKMAASMRNEYIAKQQQVLQDLARESERILDLVPPDRPPCFRLPEVVSTSSSGILSSNVRELSQLGSDAPFEAALRSILAGAEGRRRQTRRLSDGNGCRESKDGAPTKFDLTAFVRDMINRRGDCMDHETKRVANLVQNVDNLNVPVEYKVFSEEMNWGDSDQSYKTRWLCIIHVMSDFSFQKYHKSSKQGDMKLYRGFCIRLMFEDEDEDHIDDMSARSNQSKEIDYTDGEGEEGLMLKMKFLPYMVRTFGIRNGLSTLARSGLEAYDRYTVNLLKTWGMSQNAMARWQPFFHSWGLYARSILRHQEQQDRVTSEEVSGDACLPPLSSHHYLEHLEHFSELYYSGKLPARIQGGKQNECTFRGLVAVVALNKEDASVMSEKIASELGGCRCSDDINAITENDMLNAMVQGTGGLVCGSIVEDGTKTMRLLSKKYNESIYLVFVGCGDDDVDASLSPGKEKEKKKRIGMLKAWRKSNCRFQVDLPRPASAPEASVLPKEALGTLIDQLCEASNSLPKPDNRPGLLVFFPGSIPGCGKSSLCTTVNTDTLRSRLIDNGGYGSDEEIEKTNEDRNVIVRIGDKVQGKYWQLVRLERAEQPSSVYIADKNAPQSVWDTVGEICANTRGVPVPVLPDKGALATTIVSWKESTENAKEIERQHTFPLSLRYLAVCMVRVLDRPEKSHCGKLDASCQSACMVVIKFYCLYRNLTAGRLVDLCYDAMDKAGAVKLQNAIEIPFFSRSDVPKCLPQDLTEALQDAIRLQCKLDGQPKTDSADDATLVENMERRLRHVLDSNCDELQRYIASEQESQESFLTQIAEHVDTLDEALGKVDTAIMTSGQTFAKITSIDVDLNDIRRVLRDLAAVNSNVSTYLDSVGAFHQVDGNEPNQDESHRQGQVVKETHVTMAHHTQLTQMEMRSRFGTLDGNEVDVQITGFLYGKSVAALSVVLPPTTSGQLPIPIPAPQNEFPHVTVWFGAGATAADSNKLPAMVLNGKATKFETPEPVTVRGKFRFWMTTNGG